MLYAIPIELKNLHGKTLKARIGAKTGTMALEHMHGRIHRRGEYTGRLDSVQRTWTHQDGIKDGLRGHCLMNHVGRVQGACGPCECAVPSRYLH
mmetsp:Transcript_26601/g.61904  ORF Transcript_26601/g.61904 Transcript_26601/m.61904 type:complete len:94 (-) Transcript_26601:45-326(-)